LEEGPRAERKPSEGLRWRIEGRQMACIGRTWPRDRLQPCYLGVEENLSLDKEGAGSERDQDGCVARPDAVCVVRSEAHCGQTPCLWRVVSMGER